MKKSFTLIELIMAIFILTVGILGVYSLFSQFMVSSSYSFQRLVAIYLLQEGAELIRNIRDSNLLEGGQWNEGLTNCSAGCIVDYTMTNQQDPYLPQFAEQTLNIDNNGYYSYSSGSPTPFKRKITILPQNDFLEIKIDVFWQERGRLHNVSAKEKLYNW